MEMMETIFADPQSFLLILAAVVCSGILAVIGFFAVKLILAAMKKMGIELTDKQVESVQGVVTNVVKFLNQKLVSVFKNLNEDGKLTDEQKDEVYQKAIQLINTSVTEEQKQALIKKYGDFDMALEILTEAAVADNHVTKDEVVELLPAYETSEYPDELAD